ALLVCPGLGAATMPVNSPPREELRYTVSLGSLRPSGVATYKVDPDGESVVTLMVSDRGRGESLTSRLRLDAAGIPVREHLSRSDYWKNQIDESFEIAGGKAFWKSGAETGDKRISRPAFYITRSGGDLELGLLAQALLKARRHRLLLPPEGEPRIESAGAARIEVGGKPRSLSLYAISGLASSPVYVWMERPDLFFGRYDGFLTVVPQGSEDAAPAMIKAQVQAMTSREKTLASKL